MSKYKEIVLFPTEEQFETKYGELYLDTCYWTIPFYPKDKESLIGSKIYFYDKRYNYICLRATITKFDEVDSKKAVFFKLNDDDNDFCLQLDDINILKRKQTRGWAYRWFPIQTEVII